MSEPEVTFLVARAPWTITGSVDAKTFTVHHIKNYIPDEHSMRDLIQLARCIRTAEKWARRTNEATPRL